MADADPLAKRRRLNSAVHKPFVSPLKSRAGNTPQRPLSSDGIFKRPASPLSTTTATSRTPQPLSTLHKVSDFNTSPFVPASSTTALSLSKQLTKLRSDVDTLRQAQIILSQAKAKELTGLRDKWRDATRLAAEELFAIMQDKMNRMGGVAAWRAGEMKKRQRMEDWRREDEEAAERDLDRKAEILSSDDDDDEEGDEDEGNVVPKTEEEKKLEKEGRRAQRAAMRVARDEAKLARKEAMENAKFERENDGFAAEEREAARKADREKGLIGNDDDSYTMSMMLAQLNVELDVIGYDRQQERWLDP